MMTEVAPQSHQSAYASGCAVLIDALVDPDQLQRQTGTGSRWSPGASEFRLRQVELNRFIRNADRGVITEEHRRENFSEVAAELLYGSETPDDGLYGSVDSADAFPLRWHAPADDQLDAAVQDLVENGDDNPVGLFQHRISQMDVVVAPKFASATGTTGLARRRRAILILHLSTAAGGDSIPALNSATVSEYQQVFRQAVGRIPFLEALQEYVGPSVQVIGSPHAGSSRTTSEALGNCYPVMTDLNLKFGDDDDALLIRELATVTPSRGHGSTTPEAKKDRLKRTRAADQWTFLSDSWSMMATRHGTLFYGTDERGFAAANLYASSLYVDVIALARLESLLLADFLRGTQASIQKQDDIDTDQALLLRRRLMGLKSTFDKAHHTETNNSRTIIEQMRVILRTEELVRDATDDLEDIGEVASLKRDKREAWTNRFITLLLGVLTIAGVPMTVLFTWLQLRDRGPETVEQFWWISGGIGLVVVIGVVIMLSIWQAKKPRRDN